MDEYSRVKNADNEPIRSSLLPAPQHKKTWREEEEEREEEIEGNKNKSKGGEIIVEDVAYSSIDRVINDIGEREVKKARLNPNNENSIVAYNANSQSSALTAYNSAVAPKERIITEGTSRALALRREKKTVETPDWHAPWKLMRVISGHLGWVRCVAVDPSNEWFATGAADRLEFIIISF